MPTGWTAPRPGYWGEIEDGRDTLAIIKTAQEEATAWEKAYYTSEANRIKFENSITKRFDDMEAALLIKDKIHKQEVRKAKAPGWGVFIGGAVNHNGEFTPAFGVGIVWRF